MPDGETMDEARRDFEARGREWRAGCPSAPLDLDMVGANAAQAVKPAALDRIAARLAPGQTIEIIDEGETLRLDRDGAKAYSEELSWRRAHAGTPGSPVVMRAFQASDLAMRALVHTLDADGCYEESYPPELLAQWSD